MKDPLIIALAFTFLAVPSRAFSPSSSVRPLSPRPVLPSAIHHHEHHRHQQQQPVLNSLSMPTKNSYYQLRPQKHRNAHLFLSSSSTSGDADASDSEPIKSSSSSSSTTETDPTIPTPKIDQVLSKLTSLFPLFVLGSAILGSYVPTTLNWVNNGNLISMMLAGVMLGTGMTLERSDFTDILTSRTKRTSIPIGVACQFLLMPLFASIIGRTFLLPYHDPQTMQHVGKHLFLGLVLVGCSPGGTASNLVSLIAGADVALSVLLTSCSTVLASAITPLLTKFIVGSAVPVSGMALCAACAKVVLAPVALGVTLNEYMPKLCKWVSRWTPFASVVLVSLICGGVVANNSAMWTGGAASAGLMSLPALILISVIMTHTLGFAAGYLVPKHLFKFPERTARTISIETGMQNSALAVVLAKSIGADPISYLPGALSATAHSCLGSGLAAFWRVLDSRKKEEDENDSV